MLVSNVANTSYTTTSQQAHAQKTVNGSAFAQIMEQTRNTQTAASTATTDAAKRAAEVRTGLDEQTLAQLNKYAEIYNKYAAQYGDGFELKGRNCTDGDVAAEEAYKKYNAIRDAFNKELHAAGVPGAYAGRVAAADYSNGEINAGSITFAEYKGSISALFYAEKYGIAGLSPEEQCAKVLGSMKTSSYKELNTAIDLLYQVGAISGADLKNIDHAAFNQAVAGLGKNYSTSDLIAAMSDSMDWSSLLDSLNSEAVARR